MDLERFERAEREIRYLRNGEAILFVGECKNDYIKRANVMGGVIPSERGTRDYLLFSKNKASKSEKIRSKTYVIKVEPADISLKEDKVFYVETQNPRLLYPPVKPYGNSRLFIPNFFFPSCSIFSFSLEDYFIGDENILDFMRRDLLSDDTDTWLRNYARILSER
jgi:hypothetical protein